MSSDKRQQSEPVNNDLTRLIDRMHDVILDTEASGRPAGNLFDVWWELKGYLENRIAPSHVGQDKAGPIPNAAPSEVKSAGAQPLADENAGAAGEGVSASEEAGSIPAPAAITRSSTTRWSDPDYVMVRLKDVAALTGLVPPQPVEVDGKKFQFVDPNPESTLLAAAETVKVMMKHALPVTLSATARLSMPKQDEILLACGELNASELRAVKAALGWFIRRNGGEA